MSTLTSRPDRDSLLPSEQALVDREANMIAAELRLWLPDAEREAIKHAPTSFSFSFYTELARSIRNEYDLWLEEHHITKIWVTAKASHPDVDVDCHPCHPDNFSALCIQRLWEILQ